MARIDPEQERRRLAEFYANQMNGELERVASQSNELTELAREALRAELAKRGLQTEFVETAPVIAKPVIAKPVTAKPVTAQPVTAQNERPVMPGNPPPSLPSRSDLAIPDADVELRELVTVRTFRDLPAALLAKGSLESAGIETFLADDNMVRLDWFWSNLMGGIKLQVNQEDAEIANRILDQPIPEGFDVPGIGEYQQPRCPSCQSLDVTFQELDQPVAYVSAYLNLPIPWKRRAWRCHACNAEWEDTDRQEAGESQAGQDHPDQEQPDIDKPD